jgi:hypothetical protein
MLATKSIKGVVRAGRIEPTEALDAPDGTEVTITVPIKPARKGKMITFGMFSDPTRPYSTEEDFREARRSIWGDVDAE